MNDESLIAQSSSLPFHPHSLLTAWLVPYWLENQYRLYTFQVIQHSTNELLQNASTHYHLLLFSYSQINRPLDIYQSWHVDQIELLALSHCLLHSMTLKARLTARQYCNESLDERCTYIVRLCLV